MKKYFTSILLLLLFIGTVVYASTTIGTDINTGGTVTGLNGVFSDLNISGNTTFGQMVGNRNPTHQYAAWGDDLINLSTIGGYESFALAGVDGSGLFIAQESVTPGDAQNYPQAAGIYYNHRDSTATGGNTYGLFVGNYQNAGTINNQWGLAISSVSSAGSTASGVYAIQVGFGLEGTHTNVYGVHIDAISAGTNRYPFWSDEQGVFRIKADNTFNSVYQAIPALYNPQFTKYTAGATDYERIVLGQWNSNVAEIGTEAGGTGTLRPLRLLGPSVEAVSYKTATNCADSAGAAACGSAAAGAFVIDAGTTSTVVSTTAVTASSEIEVQFDSSLGTRLGITCNTAPATVAFPSVTARTAGTSFTLSVTGTVAVNPACFTYSIVN
jgi:hypothetical protein